ncbi:hypothetical protein Tco_0218830 [Tanacetum coccineum]
METSKDVYLRHMDHRGFIILKIKEILRYSQLEESYGFVDRMIAIYKFREGDFKRLCRQDIEDMLLLLVQGKLTNLSLDDRYALNVALRMILKDGGEDFRYSDTERLSRSDEVLKLKNFKKDATLKLSKSTNQEWYEHVGPEVTRSQDDKVTRWRNEIMLG